MVALSHLACSCHFLLLFLLLCLLLIIIVIIIIIVTMMMMRLIKIMTMMLPCQLLDRTGVNKYNRSKLHFLIEDIPIC